MNALESHTKHENDGATSGQREVAFYVTEWRDHLNVLVPEFSVMRPITQARPYLRVPDLREKPVPGVVPVTFPELPDWEAWKCNWTQDDLDALGVVADYEADETYVDQWPDAWYIHGLVVNEKAKLAYEAVAPGACLFFPVRVFSRQTGKQLPVQRWSLYTRHWLFYPKDPEWIELDTDFGRHRVEWLKIAKEEPQRALFEDFGIFSKPGSMSIGAPVYVPRVFEALKDAGITGLTEKTSKSILSHEFREVIGHVWQ